MWYHYSLLLLFIIADLAYLQSQGILNINWEKLQTLSQPLLSSIDMGSTGTGHGAITSVLHSNLPFLPVDMGIPLAGGVGLRFVFGLRI
jgi:uncharacterized membrane protein (Fun14 family)